MNATCVVENASKVAALDYVEFCQCADPLRQAERFASHVPVKVGRQPYLQLDSLAAAFSDEPSVTNFVCKLCKLCAVTGWNHVR
ncbi:MAG: hypothetical protein J4N96_00690 [Chloroflexi bacterium]|nr:hypothetical protein [Chloroflexota bacterium]